jgi:hypothetical protein
MRWTFIALLLLTGPAASEPGNIQNMNSAPCRDETRKIAALKDRVTSLERTLEAERFDKIDLNYKVILTSLALNKSEAVVASLKVENARLKAVPVPIAASAVPVPPLPAKIIPPSSKSPKPTRHLASLKRKKQNPTSTKPHSWNVVKQFWP